jgi:hypothetical protein
MSYKQCSHIKLKRKGNGVVTLCLLILSKVASTSDCRQHKAR